jgi:SAM-dependent methyltransferase
MTDWTEGYVSDIEYTTGFYRELSPRFLTYIALLQRCRALDISKPFNYCELACGQGFSTNVLAALYPHANFYGIDFNPAHIASARSLASEADLDNVEFREESFQVAREVDDHELPPMDFITLHGTYTWVAKENRRAIVEFIKRKLRPGGIVYISYNCMPGWLQMMPLQHLMQEHALRHPDRSDRQVEGALDFIESLNNADTRYFEANTSAAPRLKKMREKNTRYLAHEYITDSWEPLYHTDVVRDVAGAKLDYMGSAGLLENFVTLSVPEKTRKLYEQYKDPAFRELIKDFAINQQFRRDVFVKGQRRLTSTQERHMLQALTFAPLRTRENMSYEFRTPLGRATGQENLYKPILDAVEGGPKKLADLQETADPDMGRLVQASAALTTSAQMHPVVDDMGGTATASARRLNRAVAQRVLIGDAYTYLAAPAIGNGIACRDHEIIAYDVLSHHNVSTADDLAQGMWARFKEVGRRLVKDGQTLWSDEENLNEFRNRAEDILENQVPVWKHLRIL